MSSFESIRSAQGKDPYLARADGGAGDDGEDAVDLDLIRKTASRSRGSTSRSPSSRSARRTPTCARW